MRMTTSDNDDFLKRLHEASQLILEVKPLDVHDFVARYVFDIPTPQLVLRHQRMLIKYYLFMEMYSG